MNKLAYILAGVAVCAAFTSCEDDKEPVYKAPTTFTINEPALNNQYLATSDNMEDKSTFVITASQPDYGYSAICNYNAQVSLTPEFTEGNFVNLENQDVHNAKMSFRTYDLATSLCALLGVDSPEAWEQYIADKEAAGQDPYETKVYFRGICNIEGVEGSEIVSNNVVSYNKVQVQYAVPTAAWVYVAGHVSTLDGSAENNFLAPAAANAAAYENFKLIEPVIGSKVFAGAFMLRAGNGEVQSSVDDCSQWRFFLELLGWDELSAQVGSDPANFFVLDITNDFVDGTFQGPAVNGQGNWGVWNATATPITLVLSTQSMQTWAKYGVWDVTLELGSDGKTWQPVWNAE